MVTINGTDLSTYGFVARTRRIPRLTGLRASIVEVPNGEPIRLGQTGRIATLEIDGSVSRTTHALELTAIDNVAAALRGTCTVRFSDITDREWIGTLDPSSIVEALYAPWIARASRVYLVFVLDSPYARAQSATTVIGANPTLVLGNAPSLLDIDVQNGAGAAITEIVVAVRAGTTVLRTLTWTGNVASGDLWQLTMDPAWEITNAGANAIDGLSDTSEWPIADPAEGATNLLVTVTGGTGVVVTTRYRRRW